jgi:hypothetical protein
MARTPSLKRIQKSYVSRVNGLVRDNKGFHNVLLNVQNNGDNYISGKSRSESKVYDETWISQLEVGFGAIDRIIQNPRKFIKEEQEVVLSALAKKVTVASIQHLAAHSEFVHGVDKRGNIIPEKILTISTEEDLQIYENRFVMTLIQKLVLFIEKRYNFIRDHGETRNSDVLLIHSQVTIDGVSYEVDNRLKVSVPSLDEGKSEKNAELLAKITRLRERATFYLHCPFMQGMAGAKAVHNPISMTNMLLKNPDYHKAYELWKFIDNYTKLGVSYSIKEANVPFDDQYYKEIYALVLGDMMTVHSNYLNDKKALAGAKSKKKVLTPRVLLSLEDETFLNHKFTYTPISLTKYVEKKEDERLAPAPDKIKEMKEQEALRLAQEASLKKSMEDKAKAKKEATILKEAEEEARKEKRRQEAEAKRLAKEEALRRKQEALAAKKAEELRKKQEKEQLNLEEELLRKAREDVRRSALADRNKEPKAKRKVASPKVAVVPAPVVVIKKEEPKIYLPAVIIEKKPKLADTFVTPEVIITPVVKPVIKKKKATPKKKAKVVKKPVIKKEVKAESVKEVKPEPVKPEPVKEEVKPEPVKEVKPEPVKPEPVKEEVKPEPVKKTKPKVVKKAKPKAKKKAKPAPKKVKPKKVEEAKPAPVVKPEPVVIKEVAPVVPKKEKKKKKPFIRVSYAKKKAMKLNLKKKGKKFVPHYEEIKKDK